MKGNIEMKRTRYEVEQDVNAIEQEIKSDYELEDYWYGDCYPDVILSLENEMELCKDEDEYELLLARVKMIFEDYVPNNIF